MAKPRPLCCCVLFGRPGLSGYHNATGANLLNGLATALLADTNLIGYLEADFAILEVDENVLPLVLKECQPASSWP